MKSYESPLGPLTLTLDKGGISSIDFGAGAEEQLSPDDPLRAALDDYFRSGQGLDELPVVLQAGDFQRAVLETIRTIPPGETRTYEWVAGQIGRPRAARAVGNALGANPIPIVIPCHRVVGANGVGGYTGGLERKQFLLDLEASPPKSAGARL